MLIARKTVAILSSTTIPYIGYDIVSGRPNRTAGKFNLLLNLLADTELL